MNVSNALLRGFVLFAGLGAGEQLYAQSSPSAAPAPPAPQPVETARLEPSSSAVAMSLHALDEEAGSTTAAATTNDSGPAGIVPMRRGFNMSLGTTSQHDSAGGWASLLTPNVAYRFGTHFSVNAGVPVYTYINIYSLLVTSKDPLTTPNTYGFRTRNFLLGDTTIAGSFEAHPFFFDYNVTATLGTPTGDDDNGLGAGQPTFNINNHFEKPLGIFTPDLELGVGDSPNLVDSRVRKTYVDVGQNAHFQIGTSVQLPWSMTFSSDAYEELPLSTQTVTTTTTNGKKGKQLKVITTSSTKSVGEDNGFLNSLDIPLNGHITLSGFYNRSLRNKIDTAGFSFTFILRSTRNTEAH